MRHKSVSAVLVSSIASITFNNTGLETARHVRWATENMGLDSEGLGNIAETIDHKMGAVPEGQNPIADSILIELAAARSAVMRKAQDILKVLEQFAGTTGTTAASYDHLAKNGMGAFTGNPNNVAAGFSQGNGFTGDQSGPVVGFSQNSGFGEEDVDLPAGALAGITGAPGQKAHTADAVAA